MNIRLLSDLHFENKILEWDGRDNWLVEEFVTDQQYTDQVDVLVLAGDIANAISFKRLRGVLEPFSQVFKQVVYVPGNHEHWHVEPEGAITLLKEVAATFKNVHVLDNEVVEIDGKRFVGGTGWFDLSPTSLAHLRYVRFKEASFSDFRVIGGNPVKFIRDRGEAFKTMLKRELRKGDVVVSHHAPSQRSIRPQYMGASNNCYYVHDMPNWVWEREPALWFHGHMHTSMHYRMNETTVVCNPKGHAKDEPTGFQKDLIITLP